MRHRLTALAATLLLPVAAAANPAPDLPRPLLVHHGDLDPAWVGSATWTAWRSGDPSSRVAVSLAPTSADGWSVATVVDPASNAAPWVVLGEGDGRAATLVAFSGAIPRSAESVHAPVVTADPQPGAGAVLRWGAAGAPALSGWRLERSTDGLRWEDLGLHAPGSTGTQDAGASGATTWRLVPVLHDGVVVDAPGRASDVTWAGDGDLDDDGVGDATDRCRLVADPAQADTDGDGRSDACEFAWADVVPRGAPDGVIGIGDAVRVLRFAVGLDTPTATELRAADVAPAIVLGSRATPRVALPPQVPAIAVDDAVLVLRAAVGLVQFEPPR